MEFIEIKRSLNGINITYSQYSWLAETLVMAEAFCSEIFNFSPLSTQFGVFHLFPQRDQGSEDWNEANM